VIVPIVISVVGLLTAILVPIVQARVSRKKAPEDAAFLQTQREAIISETAVRVQDMFNDCLGQLDRVLDENKDHRHRIILLEREVVRLGGDPSRLNGGTVT